MSTEARISAALPNQHGLGDDLLEQHFAALIEELPVGHVAAVVLLQPKDTGTTRTADGVKRYVRYEIARLEVPTGGDQHRVRDLILSGHASRVGGEPLPLDWTSKAEADQKSILLEKLLDWSERREVDLNASWWERFDRAHVPAPKNASLQQLRDFAIDMRVLDPEESKADADGAGTVVFSDAEEPPPVKPAPKKRAPKKAAAPKAAQADEPPLDEE